MTPSDDITRRLTAANPVPSVNSLVPAIAEATEFLAIVKEIEVTEAAAQATDPLGSGSGSEPSRGPHQSKIDEELGADLIFDELRPHRERSAPAKRRHLVGVVASVAATTLVLIGALVVTDRNRSEDVSDPVFSPSVTVPSVSSPGLDDDVNFGRAPVWGSGQQVFSVTVGGPGLVAVGKSHPDRPETPLAVWTSVDGVDWSRVPHDEAVFGGPDKQWMWSVTAGGPGLVAVGAASSGTDEDAAVWTSVDGITWSRVPHDQAVFGGATMLSVTVGGPGLVAVGNSKSGGPDSVAAVWTSVDGVTWLRVPHDEAVFGGPDEQWMNEVIVGGPGLVAVGTDGRGAWDNNGGLVAAVWTSVDGVTWSRVPHDEAVFGQPDGASPAMIRVAAGGLGLVAVGSSNDNRAVVWISVDGIAWSRIPLDEGIFGDGGFIFDLTAGGPGLVAIGNSNSVATAFTSVDGITWSKVPLLDEAGDPALFYAGYGWNVISTGSGFVAIGEHSSEAALWTSVDGIAWSRVTHEAITEAD
jgi:hypothetical protein